MTIPKRYYRYGIAAEKDLFDGIRDEDSVYGFVLPAQLIVDQRMSLSPWLRERTFFIDPMTHVWFSDLCDLRASDGKTFKRSYEKLRQEYDSPFSDLSPPGGKLDAASILSSPGKLEHFIASAERVVSFQSTYVQDRIDEEIVEYNRILAEEGYGIRDLNAMAQDERTKPDRLVLPYVYFTSTQTSEYELNKRIWDWFANKDRSPVPYCAMIATSEPSSDWDAIVRDLKGKVTQVIVWFSQINEQSSGADQLIRVRKACSSLAKNDFHVHLHSGGAFAMGLGFDGVESVSGGATYGERRPMTLVEGGPVPQRYFIPQLLRVFPLAEATFAFERLGLDCNNRCCEGLDSDVNAFVERFFPGKKDTSWGPTWYTKLHYALRFAQKMDEIWKDGKSTGLSRLTEMMHAAESAGLHEDYWQHLNTWIEAYSDR